MSDGVKKKSCCERTIEQRRAWDEGYKHGDTWFHATWKNPYLAKDNELALHWRRGYDEMIKLKELSGDMQ